LSKTNDYSPEDIEFIKILANRNSASLEKEIRNTLKSNSKICLILREYYRENTLGIRTGWSEEFEKLGITDDDGKAAIAYARRLGVEFY